MIGKRSFESFEAFENRVGFPWLGFRGFNVFFGCCLQKTSVGMSLIVEVSSYNKMDDSCNEGYCHPMSETQNGSYSSCTEKLIPRVFLRNPSFHYTVHGTAHFELRMERFLR